MRPLLDGIEWCTYEEFEGACVEFDDPDRPGSLVRCRCREKLANQSPAIP